MTRRNRTAIAVLVGGIAAAVACQFYFGQRAKPRRPRVDERSDMHLADVPTHAESANPSESRGKALLQINGDDGVGVATLEAGKTFEAIYRKEFASGEERIVPNAGDGMIFYMVAALKAPPGLDSFDELGKSQMLHADRKPLVDFLSRRPLQELPEMTLRSTPTAPDTPGEWLLVVTVFEMGTSRVPRPRPGEPSPPGYYVHERPVNVVAATGP